MSETTMPAIEANEALLENELQSYELAFHILPTVAEGEVKGVFDAVKALITKDGGEIFDEEAPERFELAYEIIKHLEGKNRKFASAYFGWVRFKAPSENIASLQEEVQSRGDILRHLLLKLTRIEEENPFRFHPALESFKMVETINQDELATDAEVTEEVAEEVTDPVIIVEDEMAATAAA
jgi:ribosomal protein S6